MNIIEKLSEASLASSGSYVFEYNNTFDILEIYTAEMVKIKSLNRGYAFCQSRSITQLIRLAIASHEYKKAGDQQNYKLFNFNNGV